MSGKVGSGLATGDVRFASMLYDVVNGQSLAKISPRLSVERGAHGANRLPDFPNLSTAGIRRSHRSTNYPGDRGIDRLSPDLPDNVSLCFRWHLQRIAEEAIGEKEAPQVNSSSRCK